MYRPIRSIRPGHAAGLHRRGFTLIELLIAVAVACLLAALTYPSYQSQLAKGRRADARQALLELSQKMERHHTERGTYLGAAVGAGGLYPGLSSGGHYSLAISAQTPDGFMLRATPRGGQADDACASFLYDQLGEQRVSSEARLSAASCWQS
ncbi:MAG: type IV pilin protein [Pseudomonadota bacterium]